MQHTTDQRTTFKRGETVEFVFARIPLTHEGQLLFARRARNMQEMRELTEARAAYNGGWRKEWVAGKVTDHETDGSYRVEGYYCKPEDVRPLTNNGGQHV